MSQLVPIAKIRELFSWWPYAPDGTYRLIRLKRLGAVRVGRNVYVTEPLLQAFVAKHTEQP